MTDRAICVYINLAEHCQGNVLSVLPLSSFSAPRVFSLILVHCRYVSIVQYMDRTAAAVSSLEASGWKTAPLLPATN